MEWTPVRQDGNQLKVGIMTDGVENYHFQITFESDDALDIQLRYEDNILAKGAYQRDVADAKTATNDNVDTSPKVELK